jgi:hypothetical protein
MTTDAVAPANTAKAAVEVVGVAGGASSSLWMDAAALWQVQPLTAVVEHDDDGYATVTLRELTAGQLISLYRVTQDGTRTLIRGQNGLIDRDPIATDILIVEDHEAPLNTLIYYYVELYTAAGVLASTRNSSTLSIDLADINMAWLKDPGYPTRNLQVMVQRAPDWQRPIEQAAFVVRGRRNKIVLSGARQGLEGDLAIFTRTDQERAALHQLLSSGNVLLWQAVPGMGVADMYVNVGAVTEARLGGLAQEPWRVWTLPLTEADMPTETGVNGASDRTWQDVLSEFSTWQAVLDAYATWEDVLLNRRK